MTNSLVDRLRAMARAEHDDLSIGAEAADRIEELEKEVAEYEKIFELQRRREQPLIERWRALTGRHNAIPDYGKFQEFLMDEIDRLNAELQQYARQRNLIRIQPSEFRWTADTADKDQDDDPAWIVEALRCGKAKIINSGTPHVRMLIHTAEKIVEARPGQWIYREADGKIGVNVR
jgi:hypothetical protein